MQVRAAAMSTLAPQRVRQDIYQWTPGYLPPSPENTLFHPTRVIKYVFLDGSQNVFPSHALRNFEARAHQESTGAFCHIPANPDHSMGATYWSCQPQRLPIFVTLAKKQKKQGTPWGHHPFSKERLPIFQKLCGEAIQAMANGDVYLEALDAETKDPFNPKAQGNGKVEK
ncbi:hypothetical protein Y1Q_0013049 [Alligator mississippiensis]|uniref:Uncharacterized protein n=1 Tax=Alligator mississippiensis TaxID=8496 RepID=A0A151N6W5_ALLMI|nr:hypothetical protein Y1Q_0013049 [Alligator mississippiensis]